MNHKRHSNICLCARCEKEQMLKDYRAQMLAQQRKPLKKNWLDSGHLYLVIISLLAVIMVINVLRGG